MLDDRESAETKKSSVQAFRCGNKKPLLTVEQEILLAQRWQEDRDAEARNHLVESFLGWGKKQASKIAADIGKTKEHAESWASDALMDAVEGFDIKRGYRFSTYASYCINTQVRTDPNGYDYTTRKQTRGVPRTIVNNFVKARERVEREARLQGETLTTHEIHERMAEKFGVPVEKITNYEIARQGDRSLNTPQKNDEGGLREWGDKFEAEDPNPSEIADFNSMREVFGQAVKNLRGKKRGGLDSRHLNIIRLRRFEGKTLGETAEILSVPGEKPLSKERVRQLEVQALERIMDEISSIAGIEVDKAAVLKSRGKNKSGVEKKASLS